MCKGLIGCIPMSKQIIFISFPFFVVMSPAHFYYTELCFPVKDKNLDVSLNYGLARQL